MLKVLWLHDNPCAEVFFGFITRFKGHPDCVKLLPNLIKLDNNPVTHEDRVNSQNAVFNFSGSN